PRRARGHVRSGRRRWRCAGRHPGAAQRRLRVAWTPHGTYARDLQHFVERLGFTPMEAILSATALGGEIMLRPDPLGKVQPGYLADLILVDASPLDDTTILQDHGKLNYIMKDVRFHSEPGDDDARHRTRTNS